MEIKDEKIDTGKAFDWGKASEDYAKYRDIYPKEIYEKIYNLGLCQKGQKILDLGTGTGVLPRNMYHYGGDFTATDIEENQIIQAKRLSEENKMNIKYLVSSAENLDFPKKSFDVITACQCFFYFNQQVTMPKFSDLLRDNGKVFIMYMAWLPFEDEIAAKSEELILKYNPKWSGCGETRRPIGLEPCVFDYFEKEYEDVYDLKVPFTKQSWHGRMKACRGVGASMPPKDIALWEKDHKEMIDKIGKEKFEVLHYVAMTVLKKKSK